MTISTETLLHRELGGYVEAGQGQWSSRPQKPGYGRALFEYQSNGPGTVVDLCLYEHGLVLKTSRDCVEALYTQITKVQTPGLRDFMKAPARGEALVNVELAVGDKLMPLVMMKQTLRIPIAIDYAVKIARGEGSE